MEDDKFSVFFSVPWVTRFGSRLKGDVVLAIPYLEVKVV